MPTAPLIKTPQVDGGTFYTFSSAAKDLSKTLGNENLKLVFSKFALLNVPNFDKLDNDTFSNFENFMQFNTIDGSIKRGGLKGDPNVNWTESFQNYALNLEQLLLSNPNYDNSNNSSVAERVFFKWLKETGAIRFRQASQLEQSKLSIDPLYVEEDESLFGDVQYQRVIKYIGDIDVINNVDRAGESFTEIYINVPTEVGSTPTILFKPFSDNNYQPNLKIIGDNEFIKNRNSNTVHPQGLDFFAFYDYASLLSGNNSGGYTDPNANWMNQTTSPSIINSYFTEPVTFNNPSNIDIRKFPADYSNPSGFSGVAYRRSKLDGISLDFNPNHYQQIVQNNKISTIQQFNGVDLSSTFEFNAVLLYYDLIDTSNSNNNATNLYGILLLDRITPTVDGGFIQRFPKFKPNKVTGQNGNSYGFKLNLKFDTSIGTAGVGAIINDYNTFSMGLFVDATTQLQESAKIFQRQQSELLEIQHKIRVLENNISIANTAASLQEQVNGLQKQLDNASLSMSNATTLLDLISKNADEIQSIANGEVSVSLQYNTDILRSGSGIQIDKRTPNQIKINAINQKYTFMVAFDENEEELNEVNLLNINTLTPKIFSSLVPFTNMLRINTINDAGGNIIVHIDDSSIQWKTGQTLRLVFNNDININSHEIRIVTDSKNRLNQGVYGVTAAVVPNSEISKRPIIELICTEQGILKFVYDVIK